MPQFVVLHHQIPDAAARASHWDLMLEDGDVLLTWALEQQPTADVGHVHAELLAPHRLHYLHFEGPLSGNRGMVRRWDQGPFDWRVRREEVVVVSFWGSRLRGTATLTRQQQAWLFQRGAPGSP